ncbi:putative polyprotein [Cinnamomum micranthum f. kanehirae]|uniref:Putative polyprotein n=1 Tax=Cinnamomum micranthum f. kanehirae TaxID=337451 RepID=A0A443NCX3_9MAGN|nr:putative polyprotein [Cinnamomum micranthum f. kanehirae]
MPSSFQNIKEIALKTIPSATKVEIKRVLQNLYGFDVEEAYVTLKTPLSLSPNLYPIRLIEEEKKNTAPKKSQSGVVEDSSAPSHWLHGEGNGDDGDGIGRGRRFKKTEKRLVKQVDGSAEKSKFPWSSMRSWRVVANIMASSHSNGSAPSFIISNISNLVSIKLDRHNYLLWRSQFEPLLLSHDLMGFVDGSNLCPEKFARDNEKKLTSTIAPAFLEWHRQDQNLLSWIRATLSEHVLSQVIGLRTSRAAWVAIEQRFASLSRAHTIELKRQLQNLQKVGHLVDESDQVTHILDGLPEEYDPVVMNVAAANQSDHVSVAYVHGLLLNMEMRIACHHIFSQSPSDQATTALFTPKNGQNNNSNHGGGRQGRGRGRGQNGGRGSPSFNPSPNSNKTNNAVMVGPSTNRGPPRVPCQICNRTGHSALDCYHRMDFTYQGSHPPNKLAAMAASNQFSVEQNWYTDTGATDHITSNIGNLSLRSDYHRPDKVSVGNGAGLHISHIGSNSISTPSSNFRLNNMLCVPHISTNLISVHRFANDNNCFFIFDSSGFCIKDKASGKTLFRGQSKNGLYPFPIRRLPTHSNNDGHAAFVGERVTASIWHSRLGHPASAVFQHLASAFQLPVDGSSKLSSICTPCQMGKSKKLPFSISSSISSNPLDLIHCDLWGSSPELSISGYSYYVSFIDDCTKYVWFYPLATKSQTFVTFLKFKAYVENMLSTTIKAFQSDGGGEFMSNRFQNFLTSHGIAHRVSCPHTPEQNGVAERKHCHIVEMGLTLLATSHMPLQYWVEAFNTAGFLINRLPTKVLNNKSPWECLFNRSPNYCFLHTFGCLCFPWLRPYNKNKLEFRSRPCVFLGYSLNHIGYRCLDIDTGRVFLSRHVVFNERIFPFQTLSLARTSVSESNNPMLLLRQNSVESSLLPNAPLPNTLPKVTNHNSASQPISPRPCPNQLPTVDPSPTLSTATLQKQPLDPKDPAPMNAQLPAQPAMTVSAPLQTDISAPLQTDISAPLQPIQLPAYSVPLQIAGPESLRITGPVPVRVAGSDSTSTSTIPTPEVISVESQGPTAATSVHSMVTRIKDGTRKPKLFSATRHPILAMSAITSATEPTCFSTAVKSPEWRAAMALEFDALQHNGTWSLVPTRPNMNIVGCKWVYKLKYKADGSIQRYKARLVAKGFHQQAGVDFMETFIPVAKPTTIRIVLSLAVVFDWPIRQLDVNNAFLNGELKEEVYMTQPQGFVDSQYPSNNSVTLHSLIQQLASAFAMKDLGPLHYFLGLEVCRSNGSLFLSQTKYAIDLLHKYKLDGAKPYSSPVAHGSKLSVLDGDPLPDASEYRSAVGALQYLTWTRPDIAFAVNQVCRFMHNPTTNHWTAVKRILRYIKGTINHGLSFTKSSRLTLTCFFDADWAGNPDDRRSISGQCVFLGNNLISWSAKKQHTVAKSSTESEYRSLAHSAAELSWILYVLKDLHIPMVHTSHYLV